MSEASKERVEHCLALKVKLVSKLDGVAPLVADPPHANSSTDTNAHLHVTMQILLCIHANSARPRKFCWASLRKMLNYLMNELVTTVFVEQTKGLLNIDNNRKCN